MYGCFAYMYVCVLHVCLYPRRPEKDVGSLKLELQTVVSHHMEAGNQTQDLWKSSQCFLTAEPSPQPLFIFVTLNS